MHAGRPHARPTFAFAAALIALCSLFLGACSQHTVPASHALPSATPTPRLSYGSAGSLVRSYSPRELLTLSDLVVVATVVGQRVVQDGVPLPSDVPGVSVSTETDVAVARVVYNPRHLALLPGARLVVHTQGGTVGDMGVRVGDEPTFWDGERVVLFLTAVYGGRYICTNGEQGAVPVQGGMVAKGGAGGPQETEAAFIAELQGK